MTEVEIFLQGFAIGFAVGMLVMAVVILRFNRGG